MSRFSEAQCKALAIAVVTSIALTTSAAEDPANLAEQARRNAAAVQLTITPAEFIDTERVRTHLPVQVRHGTSVIRAGGLDFDNLAQRLDLLGPMRGTFPPRASGLAK